MKLLCCGKDLTLAKDPASIRLQVELQDQAYDVLVDQLLVVVAVGARRMSKNSVSKPPKLNSTRRASRSTTVCRRRTGAFTPAATCAHRISLPMSLTSWRVSSSGTPSLWAVPSPVRSSSRGALTPRRKSLTSVFTKGRRKNRALEWTPSRRSWARKTARFSTAKQKASCASTFARVRMKSLAQRWWRRMRAMKGKLGLKTISDTIHPYPTQAEAIRKTGDLYNRTRLTPL